MAVRNTIQKILSDRLFSEKQIQKLLPILHERYHQEPHQLGETIDKWNNLLTIGKPDAEGNKMEYGNMAGVAVIPMVAKPPVKSVMSNFKIDMNMILADVEPDLLLFEPEKLVQRFNMISGTGLLHNLGQHWIVLFNAPRGFYLQDWAELTKKIYYLESKVIDLLYDMKEQKAMELHPIVKCSATTQADFDHIRTRYLFALRTGYKTLGHMYEIQTAANRPTLTDVILTDNSSFLKKFAPFCTLEEYNSFSNMIKKHSVDEDDADVYEKLAELDSLHKRQ